MKVKCESVGGNIVKIKGELFTYERLGGLVELTIDGEVYDMETLHDINETIQLYEELISLN